MSVKWFCLIDNQQYGPFPWEQVQQFVTEQRLTPEDFVRREDDEQWYQADQFPELFPREETSSQPKLPPKRKSAASSSSKSKAAKAAGPKVAAPAPPREKPAVASTPTPSPTAGPARVRVPTGTPVAPAPGVPTGVTVVPVSGHSASAASSTVEHSHHRGGRKKSNKQLTVIAGFGGVLAALAIVGIIVAVNSGDEEQPIADSDANQTAADANPATIDSPPGEPETNPAVAESNPAAATPTASEAERELLAIVRRIHSWRDASRQRAGLKDIVRIHVESAWLEISSTGGRKLAVELHVKNMSPDSSLPFSGWGSPAADPQQQVILVEGDDNVLDLLDRSPAAAADRNLAPGETLETGLMFAAPASDDFDKLRIAIPYAPIGRTDHIGYDIPRVMMADGTPTPAATASAKPQPAAPATAQSATAAPPAAMSTQQSGEPETIADLKETIEQSKAVANNSRLPTKPAGMSTAAGSGEPDSIAELKESIEASRKADSQR